MWGLWWRICGYRKVYERMIVVNPATDWEKPIRHLLPPEGKEIIMRYGGYDNVKTTVAIVPPLMLDFTIWAKGKRG